MPGLELRAREHIATITINRPATRNALDMEAMYALADAVEQLHADTAIRAVILTGAGGAFISGGDLNELHALNSRMDAARFTDLMRHTLNRLAELPSITLAAIEGPARGGGCEVALACDWRVAARTATLGFAQINLGVTTGWGGAHRLKALVGYARALELLALGEAITGEEAWRIGLVNRLADPGQTLSVAYALARLVADQPPEVVRAYKRILTAETAHEANALERDQFPELWVGEAHVRAIARFMQSR